MEDPLLLVSEKLDNDEEDHGPAEKGVIWGCLIASDAGGEKEDVGRGSNQPEEDLGKKSALR